MKLIVRSAKGLLQRDGAFTGKSDPFVKVLVGGEVVLTTATVEDKLNPVWDTKEESATFDISLVTEESPIILQVWEDDSGLAGSDDFMGKGIITAEFLQSSLGEGEMKEHEVVLRPRRGETDETVAEAESLGSVMVSLIDYKSSQETSSNAMETTTTGSQQGKQEDNKDQVNSKEIEGPSLIIVKGTDLPQMDGTFTGKSDPFVKVLNAVNDDELFRTRTIDDKLNPIWNEEFSLPSSLLDQVQEDSPAAALLKIQVWEDDSGLTGADDFMGQVLLSWNQVVDGEHTFPLEKRKNEEEDGNGKKAQLGNITLRFSNIPPLAESKPRETGAEKHNTTSTDSSSVELTIVRAVHLLQRDGGAFTGKSDPFVKVFQEDQEIYRTKTVDDKLNPLFQEALIVNPQLPIRLEVWEDDNGLTGADDFMGCAFITVKQIQEHPGGEINLDLCQREEEEDAAILDAETLGTLTVEFPRGHRSSENQPPVVEKEQTQTSKPAREKIFVPLEERLSEIESADIDSSSLYISSGDGATSFIKVVDDGSALLASVQPCEEQEEVWNSEAHTFFRRCLKLASSSSNVGSEALQIQVLNAMALAQKRLGHFRPALSNLLHASELEGGLESCGVKTLLNLSATYCSLLMFAEAASIANAAVLRCSTDFQAGGPVLRATAHHNLAAALEGLGELGHAQESYQMALTLIASMRGTSTYRTIERASEQLELKLNNIHATSEQDIWGREVMPGVASQSHKTRRRRNGELPPVKNAHNHHSAATPAGGRKSISERKQLPPSQGNSRALVPLGQEGGGVEKKRGGGGDHSYANSSYSQKLKKNIVMKPIVLPVSMMNSPQQQLPSPNRSDRLSVTAPSAGAGRRSLSRTSQQQYAADYSGLSGVEEEEHGAVGGGKPEWNSDPVPQSRQPHRIGKIPKNSDLEQHINDRYISKFFIPLAEDLRYKENTRRHAISREWKKKFDIIKRDMRLQFIAAVEDQERATTEIEELRVRRVLLHWVRGKLLFAECSYQCEAEESEAREEILKEFIEASSILEPQAKRLNIEANAEDKKYRLLIQEASSRNEIELSRETASAADSGTLAVKKAKQSLSYAMSQWCMECVMEPQDAAQLADDSQSNSLHFLERYVVFGVPRKGGGTGTSVLARTSTPTGNSHQHGMHRSSHRRSTHFSK